MRGKLSRSDRRNLGTGVPMTVIEVTGSTVVLFLGGAAALLFAPHISVKLLQSFPKRGHHHSYRLSGWNCS
jgi:hypothetical protein